MVNRTSAAISDSAGTRTFLVAIRKRPSRLKHLSANSTDDRGRRMGTTAVFGVGMGILRRLFASGFKDRRSLGSPPNVLSGGSGSSDC